MELRGLGTGVLAIVVAGAVVQCGGSGSTPTGNSTPSPTPGPVVLAMFTDPVSGFSTSDVRDVQGEIVRFDRTSNSLIWVADGRAFPGYPISGNFIGENSIPDKFQVRFGIENGERRAYFTETATAKVCDVVVVNGAVTIFPTNVTVPGT